jgi:2-dehydropantoate 2-reductase
MRYIVYGVGAIGGTIAAGLALAGEEVAGIARGAQLDAIGSRGLLFRTPERVTTVAFPCYAAPSELELRDDDVIFLTMKGQNTAAALERLLAAGAREQPIFCMQNGVANERAALRFFPNVYGVTVIMPSVYLVPGEVNVFCVPSYGILFCGRYPAGRDARLDDICARLTRANFGAFADDDVMAAKHGKLLLNLRNVIEAALGPETDSARFYAPVRAEAEAVYLGARIMARDVEKDPRRGQLMQLRDIEGVSRTGGSSTQSLVRGAGSIETDYLNGEIVLQGRLNGVPTPLNSWLCDVGRRLIDERLSAGSISPAEMARGLGLA